MNKFLYAGGEASVILLVASFMVRKRPFIGYILYTQIER